MKAREKIEDECNHEEVGGTKIPVRSYIYTTFYWDRKNYLLEILPEDGKGNFSRCNRMWGSS